MNEILIAVIVAVATSIVTGVGSFILNWRVIRYRLDRLEKKVDSHNNYAKLFAECKQDIEVIKNDVSWFKNGGYKND